MAVFILQRQQRLEGLQSLKFLLPGPFQRNFLDPGLELTDHIEMYPRINPAPTDSDRPSEIAALNFSEAL